MTIAFKGLPTKESTNSYDEIRTLSNNLLQGKMNVTGSVSITANTTQTTVTDWNVGEDSFISFIGLDENSLTSDLYIKSKDVLNNSFTIGHDSSEESRSYLYIVIG